MFPPLHIAHTGANGVHPRAWGAPPVLLCWVQSQDLGWYQMLFPAFLSSHCKLLKPLMWLQLYVHSESSSMHYAPSGIPWGDSIFAEYYRIPRLKEREKNLSRIFHYSNSCFFTWKTRLYAIYAKAWHHVGPAITVIVDLAAHCAAEGLWNKLVPLGPKCAIMGVGALKIFGVPSIANG